MYVLHNFYLNILNINLDFQGSASTLLASLEREKELLRIFLKVSQMENTILRRMNLSSFLMVSGVSAPSFRGILASYVANNDCNN